MTNPAPPAAHDIRVLDAPDAAAVAREARRMGASPESIAKMAPAGISRLVRLGGMSPATAHLLEDELVGLGGMVVDRHGDGAMDLLLLATRRQYRALCARLRKDPAGLPDTATGIENALRSYDDWSGTLRCGPYTLPLGRRTYIMGIINVTPDSFAGDAVGADPDAAMHRAEAMLAAGADILDVGGESTRPGAEPVPLEEELARVIPVVRALARLHAPVSVDTYKHEVARAALEAGAVLVNDISGLRFDPAMAATVAEATAPVVVMHIQGAPRTMQQHPRYADLMTEVCACLQASTALAVAAGIPRDQVIIDPGFGFGKTVEHNLELLRRLRELRSFGQPVLLGVSRKSTIGTLLGDLPPEERVEGTGAAVTLGIAHGADIVRVHDVQAIARAARIADAVVRGTGYETGNTQDPG